jgi:DinB family protein
MNCDECGFTDTSPAVAILADAGDRFRDALTRDVSVLRRRPAPSVWSALEYAAHTRDALDFYASRIERVTSEDRPALEPFDADRLCEERGYRTEDPVDALATLDAAAARLVVLLRGLGDDQWSRVGIGTDGGIRTVHVLAARAAHEVHHHLVDFDQVLTAVSS